MNYDTLIIPNRQQFFFLTAESGKRILAIRAKLPCRPLAQACQSPAFTIVYSEHSL